MEKRLRPHQARFAMAIASLAGLFASAYLYYTYATGAPIACGIVSGCDAVRASRWANTFGVPRPLLGLVFYAGVFALLVIRASTPRRARLFYRLTMFAASLGFIESAFLFLIQWLDVKAFCLWCLASAAAATAVAGLAFFDRVEDPREISATRELRRYFASLLVFLPLAFFGFVFLTRYANVPSAISVIGQEPSVAATSTPIQPATFLLREGTPVEGPLLAKALVVEFTDFQCPACGAFHPTMQRIREEYRGRIRFAFRHFPLTNIHEYAMDAAVAAECAGKQGKLFSYADVLFAHQQELKETDLKRYAADLGLDGKAFDACYADPATRARVAQDRREAIALGVRYTPTLFVNRLRIDQALPAEELRKILDRELR